MYGPGVGVGVGDDEGAVGEEGAAPGGSSRAQFAETITHAQASSTASPFRNPGFCNGPPLICVNDAGRATGLCALTVKGMAADNGNGRQNAGRSCVKTL